jgi:hypothetical protein
MSRDVQLMAESTGARCLMHAIRQEHHEHHGSQWHACMSGARWLRERHARPMPAWARRQ